MSNYIRNLEIQEDYEYTKSYLDQTKKSNLEFDISLLRTIINDVGTQVKYSSDWETLSRDFQEDLSTSVKQTNEMYLKSMKAEEKSAFISFSSSQFENSSHMQALTSKTQEFLELRVEDFRRQTVS